MTNSIINSVINCTELSASTSTTDTVATTDTVKKERKRREKSNGSDLSDYTLIDTQWKVSFYMNKKTYNIHLVVNEFNQEIDKVNIDLVKEQICKKEIIKTEISNINVNVNTYEMWDVVLLYWPTGSGKTFNCIERCKQKGIDWSMITISNWFEEIDFLTYIQPTNTGIVYKEKSVVQLLRSASQWNKVALIIDEVNRWSTSFMNFLLKLVDKVSWYYELNNFIADEIIRIPVENIVFFCTANLGSNYVGTSAFDAAMFDRFTKVSFVNYSKDVEENICSHFWEYKKDVLWVVEKIREMYDESVIQRPFTTRSLKTRCDNFLS